jgi:hypothetical protein
MHVAVVGDSLKSNSLGRVISMAISARSVTEQVSVYAYRDGTPWPGADQFRETVIPIDRGELRHLADDLRKLAQADQVVVWISKGASPLPWFAGLLRDVPNLVIVADFDDHDVSIMESFRAQSTVNRLKMNRLRRKHPVNLLRSQRKLAQYAHATTFSNRALRDAYRTLLSVGSPTDGIVPHSRVDPGVTPGPRSARARRVGFLGTVRPHKGATQLIGLMRADRDLEVLTFAQSWSPPDDCRDQWIEAPPSTPLVELYSQIDFVVLPMSPTDPASLYQLPAKLVDAAAMGCPVACTMTSPIAEFASGAVLGVGTWNAPHSVIQELQAADTQKLSKGIRTVYESHFSPRATGAVFAGVARQAFEGAARGA